MCCLKSVSDFNVLYRFNGRTMRRCWRRPLRRCPRNPMGGKGFRSRAVGGANLRCTRRRRRGLPLATRRDQSMLSLREGLRIIHSTSFRTLPRRSLMDRSRIFHGCRNFRTLLRRRCGAVGLRSIQRQPGSLESLKGMSSKSNPVRERCRRRRFFRPVSRRMSWPCLWDKATKHSPAMRAAADPIQ